MSSPSAVDDKKEESFVSPEGRENIFPERIDTPSLKLRADVRPRESPSDSPDPTEI